MYIQIPYLDEWSTLQEDYSVYLSEAAQALLNAAVQLPIGVNVKVLILISCLFTTWTSELSSTYLQMYYATG